MSSRTQVSFVVALLALLSACQPTLQDGQFTCTTDPDCPQGFSCRASDGLCYRGGEDGGVGIDAQTGGDGGPSDDAGPRDASVPVDAPTGCGPDCIQVMVLNADPTLTGVITFYDGVGSGDDLHVPIPAYGTTSATIDVPNVDVGGTVRINVPPTATSFQDLAIPAEGRYLMVLGPSSLSASVLLLPSDPAGLHSNGYAYVRLIDMTVDETVGLIARGAGMNPADEMLANPFRHGVISDQLPFLPDSTGALRLELNGGSPTMIAALPADQIPGSEGTYYIVVSGYVGAHLGSPDGLQFIPGIPSAMSRPSSPLVRFLNTLATSATVCDGTTPLATLASGALSTPRVPPRTAAWPLEVHTGSDCTTGVVHDVTVGTSVGRTLVSIAGDSGGAWQAVPIGEPLPTSGAYKIVLHNALPGPSDIAGVTGIPSLGTGSATEFAAPTTITATTAAGLRAFEWVPTARQSWAVIRSTSGSYVAHEVDSPFDAPWTVREMPGL